MFLDRINNLVNSVKKNVDTQNFINELKEEVDNPKECIGILDKFKNENKLALGTKNKMDSKMDEILKDYAKETADNGDLYYIVEKKENEYIVYKYENEEDSVLKILESDLPSDVKIDTVLRLKDENYYIDEDATLEIEKRILNMANELLEEQSKVLEDYRKEGHLYRVSEKINEAIFLNDITDNPGFEVEEVDFPEELLSNANEGTIFIYEDGTYKLKGE